MPSSASALTSKKGGRTLTIFGLSFQTPFMPNKCFERCGEVEIRAVGEQKEENS
jgi:hypothetical protein